MPAAPAHAPGSLEEFLAQHFDGVCPAAGTVLDITYGSGSRAGEHRLTTFQSFKHLKSGPCMMCAEGAGGVNNRTYILRLISTLRLATEVDVTEATAAAPVKEPEAGGGCVPGVCRV